MRFHIRIDPLWRPLLLLGGATHDNSFVEITPDTVTFRFGFFFSRAYPRDQIFGAAQRNWPLWMGVGWRHNLRGVVGLIGSYNDVVEVRVPGKSRVIGLSFDRIAVSVKDPEGLIAALTPKAAPRAGAAPAAKKPATAPRSRRSTGTRTRRRGTR